MESEKKERLERAGFKFGTAAEFLGLTAEEQAVVEFKLGLSALLRRRREAQHLSQAVLAKRIGSSQSRVAKMEAGDPSVSMDLMIHAIFATGATATDLANEIAANPSRHS